MLIPNHSVRKASLATLAVVMAAAAGAQDTPNSASIAYLDLSTGPRVDDNYESLVDPVGTTSLWSTDLALGFSSQTDIQSFSATAGTRFDFGEFAEDPDNHGNFRNQFLRLDYGRVGADSAFDTYLSYRETDNGISFTRIPDRSTDLIVDQGRRSDGRFNVGLMKGRDGPANLELDFDYNRVRYFDTNDPGLTDWDLLDFDARLGLSMTRTMDLLLTAGYYDLDDLDNIRSDEIRSSIGAGLSANLNKSLTFSGVLKHEKNQYTDTFLDDRVTRIQETPTLNLDLVQERKDGTMDVSLDNRLTSTGVHTTLAFGRALELPAGNLDFSIGATRTDLGDINGVGFLSWRQDFKRSSFSVRFRSSVDTEDDEDILNSYLGANYKRDLTKLSGMDLDFFVAAGEGLEEGGTDRQQAGIGISYHHDLTRDWKLVTGYRHSYSVNEVNDTTTRNVVYATIDRRFNIRP